ncbi:hypothetical protein [Peribacillus frigoritolerans]|uniref:hypothetical protein n=1 Tax=Peribacillus frigoritolerans TaxID=450367 RepID=UPI00222FBA5B|nr:hypothetical protein [Peribacillus frigoritolerans]UZD45459.1 hypothetical protein OMJ04_17720 [Peribacillus frigoritolerans]
MILQQALLDLMFDAGKIYGVLGANGYFILIKDGEIISKENVEGLRESSGKSVIGWLKGHHS